MNKIKVLIEGYAKEVENGWIANSTTTLISLDDKTIIVDPGCNRKRLLASLANNNLTTKDIDYVLLTHMHTDHILLAGIFEHAKVVTPAEIYDDDYQIDHENIIPELDLQIIDTPGHSSDSKTYLIETNEGTYAIAGDLFWWKDEAKQETDYESLVNQADPYVSDMKILIASRKKILEAAEIIIPGHGKSFKVNK